MNTVNICDTTLKSAGKLSFRKKLDIAALLDKMEIPVIELGEINASTEDRLLIKSVAATVKGSTLAASIGFDKGLAAPCWEGLKSAKSARLIVTASLSTARMEYVYHKKAKDMLPAICEAVTECRKYCQSVELCAEDATRADFDFLVTVINEAVSAGATSVTLCDSAGTMLPEEFGQFVADTVKGLKNKAVEVGVSCDNTLGLADACAAAAIKRGATVIKASAAGNTGISLPGIARILSSRGDAFPAALGIATESLEADVKVISNLLNLSFDGKTPFEDGVREIPGNVFLTSGDSEETVYNEVVSLGYTLSPEDREKVYEAFKRIASKKAQIDLHELEVIVAAEALRVPQTYRLESFAATTGNKIDTFAHIKLSKNGEILDGVSLGNGSVDASFLAIERITGCHYELDDFQINAITEGKEAMGQTLVKLRSRGKVYSGQGISTDIVASAIEAYLNSLNKIVYEEERV